MGLQDAAALLDDAFALLLTGDQEPSPVFALAKAAVAAPAAASPEGTYLLLGTLLDGLAALRHLLSPDAVCARGEATTRVQQQTWLVWMARDPSKPLQNADLDALTASLTANASQAIVAATRNISAAWQEQPLLARLAQARRNLTSSAHLCLAARTISAAAMMASARATTKLSCVQGDVLREAALAGSSAVSQFLCAAYNASTAGAWIHPDLRGAAYISAVSQPAGCELGQQAVTGVPFAAPKRRAGAAT